MRRIVDTREGQAQEEKPFPIDVKGEEVADKGRNCRHKESCRQGECYIIQ
jgi:hypothetical protein